MKRSLTILFPLLLVSGFIWQFDLEGSLKLPYLMLVVAGGFGINLLLKPAFKLPFLSLLNLVSVFVLFPPISALLLLGVSLGLFFILTSPLTSRLKIALLVIIGGGLLGAKTFGEAWPAFQEIVPYLGTVFMFRSILYLHEKRFEKEPVSFWKQLNYFFLLPNWIFLIFPVVDYKTFHRSYSSTPSFEVLQKGIRWIALGALHLFFYRLLYYYCMPDPASLGDVFDLVQFMAVGYGLTLRLSGIFHLSVGIICLFGFDLPKAFSNHFLADGFNDLWRRINIYWKDFVMKIFYYPIYFRVKKRGKSKALVLTIIIVFVFNWLLHAYQWQWIRGSFLISVPDALFWAVFGVMVAINSWLQQKNKPQRKVKAFFSWKRAGIQSMKVAAMFAIVSALFSLWNSPTLSDWTSLFGVIEKPSSLQFLGLLAMIGAVVLIGTGLQYLHHLLRQKQFHYEQGFFYGSLLTTISFLLLFSAPPIQRWLDQQAIDTTPILTMKLNQADKERQFTGYYENLIMGNNFTSQMWDQELQKKEDWVNTYQTGIVRHSKANLVRDLVPHKKVHAEGVWVTSNSHGMRDQEYTLHKPKDHLRIALLGVSVEFGVGVEQDQVYEALLEKRLNEWGKLGKVEILNFAIIGGFLPIQLDILSYKVQKFSPDAVVYAHHGNEANNIVKNFQKIFKQESIRQSKEGTYWDSLVQKMQISAKMDAPMVHKILKPHKDEILIKSLQLMLQHCEEHELLLIRSFIPHGNITNRKVRKRMIDNEIRVDSLAHQMGFQLLNLPYEFFHTYRPEELKITPWDNHPNALAHRLIAEALFQKIKADTSLQKKLLQAKK